MFYAGYVLAIARGAAARPAALARRSRRAIRPILKWVRPVEGALAADSLIQAPRRTSASVAALMLSLALVVAFAGMARASYDSIIDWMETALNPDLFVMPSPNIVVRTIRFPASMGPEMAAIPGVERVQMVRNARVTFRSTPVMVVAVEVSSIAQTARLEPVAGNADEMYRRTAAGEGLMVSDNLAQLQHLLARRRARDSGAERCHPPADRRHRRRLLGSAGHDPDGSQPCSCGTGSDDSVNVFRVYLKPGAPAGRRAAADPRTVCRPTTGVRADQRRARSATS